MLEIRGISKSFAEKHLFDNLTFSVAPGRALFVLGGNGSGKTTLLRILAGVLEPDAGTVVFEDRTVFEKHKFTDEAPALRRQTGWLDGSEFGLDPRLTVMQNLEFFGALYGLRGRELSGRIQKSAAALNMERTASSRVETLSAGEKRRAALAKTLLHNPKILLLDEPMRSLDESGRADFSKAVIEIIGGGAAVVCTGCRPQDRPEWAAETVTLKNI